MERERKKLEPRSLHYSSAHHEFDAMTGQEKASPAGRMKLARSRSFLDALLLRIREAECRVRNGKKHSLRRRLARSSFFWSGAH
jgi:hypothetical protein